MKTKYNTELSDDMVSARLAIMVNQFYKILPIKEESEPTLVQYMKSLQRELLGCKALMTALDDDAQYLSLLSILQYLIENDCDVATVRSDVFKAINIVKRLQKKYATKDGVQHECVGSL